MKIFFLLLLIRASFSYSVLKETSLKNLNESQSEKLNKNCDQIVSNNELENDSLVDTTINDLMTQLNETTENKSLFVHNYRIKQFANLSYTKLYHALINLFEIVPHIQNHQIGNFIILNK